MHVPEQLAKGNIVLQVKNVTKGVDLRRVVIKHQEHAGEGQHDKQVERDAAHSPGVLVAHCVTIDLGRMQVQKNIGENCERTIARIGAIVRDAKDRLPKLRLLNVFVAFGFIDGPLRDRSRAFLHFLNKAGTGFFVAS